MEHDSAIKLKKANCENIQQPEGIIQKTLCLMKEA